MVTGLTQIVDRAKFLVTDNSTTILTAVGVVGTVGTAVLTGRASFKAAQIIEAERSDREKDLKFPETHVTELSKTEKTKLVWVQYLPPVATGVITVTSIILAHRISSKKIAALTIATAVSERALTEYKEKVIEKLGARQDEKIRDEIAQDRVNKYPPASNEVILVGDGQVLFYDMLTGRYFRSTMEDVKRAENKVNYEIINFMSCSLSHFYDEIGLPPTHYTDTVGWNMNNHMEVKFSTVMSEDQRPCIAIDFSRQPLPDYDKAWS